MAGKYSDIKDLLGDKSKLTKSIGDLVKKVDKLEGGGGSKKVKLEKEIGLKIERATEIKSLAKEMKSMPSMAIAISKSIGKENAIVEHFTSQAMDILRDNKQSAKAYGKASSDDKTSMAEKSWEGLLKNFVKENGGSETFEKDKREFESAKGKFMENFPKQVEKSLSPLYPLTKSFDNLLVTFQKDMQSIPGMQRAFSDDMMVHYKNGFNSFKDSVVKGFAPILAPLDAIVGPFTGIAKGMFTLGKTFMSGSTDLEKSQADSLSTLEDIATKTWEQKKKDDSITESGDKDTGMKKYFKKMMYAVGFAIGALSGMIYQYIIAPFKVIGIGIKALSGILMPKTTKKVGKWFKSVGKWFDGIGDFFKNFKKVGGIFAKLQKIMKPFMPFIKGLKSGFALGMKWLFWPLQVIMSLFDFMKGFKNTEGSIADKIMGGLAEVFIGFFELPIRLLSWVFEKIMGMFGIEVTGVADDAMGAIRDFFGNIIGWVKTLGGWIAGVASSFWNILKSVWNGYVNTVEGVLDLIPFVDADLSALKFDETTTEKSVAPIDTAADGKVKAAAQAEQVKNGREQSNAMGVAYKGIEKTNDMMRQVINNNQTNIVQGDLRDDIPTDPENMGALMMNKSWGMGA